MTRWLMIVVAGFMLTILGVYMFAALLAWILRELVRLGAWVRDWSRRRPTPPRPDE